jgi:hypothetical protein
MKNKPNKPWISTIQEIQIETTSFASLGVLGGLAVRKPSLHGQVGAAGRHALPPSLPLASLAAWRLENLLFPSRSFALFAVRKSSPIRERHRQESLCSQECLSSVLLFPSRSFALFAVRKSAFPRTSRRGGPPRPTSYSSLGVLGGLAVRKSSLPFAFLRAFRG